LGEGKIVIAMQFSCLCSPGFPVFCGFVIAETLQFGELIMGGQSNL